MMIAGRISKDSNLLLHTTLSLSFSESLLTLSIRHFLKHH